MSGSSKYSPIVFRLGTVEANIVVDDSVKDGEVLTDSGWGGGGGIDVELIYKHIMSLRENTKSSLVYRCNTDTLNKLKDEINHTIKGKQK